MRQCEQSRKPGETRCVYADDGCVVGKAEAPARSAPAYEAALRMRDVLPSSAPSSAGVCKCNFVNWAVLELPSYQACMRLATTTPSAPLGGITPSSCATNAIGELHTKSADETARRACEETRFCEWRPEAGPQPPAT
jgi:hypothetical protein